MNRLQSVLARINGSAPRGVLRKLACSNMRVCWFTRVSHALARLPALLHLFLIGLLILAVLFWLNLAVFIVVRLTRTAAQGEAR